MLYGASACEVERVLSRVRYLDRVEASLLIGCDGDVRYEEFVIYKKIFSSTGRLIAVSTAPFNLELKHDGNDSFWTTRGSRVIDNVSIPAPF